MKFAISGVVACVLCGALNLAAQELQVFKGEIISRKCSGPARGTAMFKRDGTTSPCTGADVKKGDRYVLSSDEDNTVYQLDNQKKSKAFVGRKVVVIGALDEDTSLIHVYEMMRPLPPRVTQAKSVYVLCDACVRGMLAAKLAAFLELVSWGRFQVAKDRKMADLIFLFSSNPYLGDYVTRDGPDTRPVSVDITYLDVVDPNTGESLWADSRRWGSWFVARATRDLIAEFRDRLAAEESLRSQLVK